jgi:multiple sugar transport system substrate-binding protein
MKRIRYRTAAGVTIALAGAVSLAACSSSSSSGGGGSSASGQHVTITVGCEPPTTQATLRTFWTRDVAAFEKANPNITIQSDDTNPCEDPSTFNAKLASGKMDNVFYTYFTDAANVVASGQAADIQQYASQITNLASIQAGLVNVYRQGQTSGGDLYGVPRTNYTMGLVYNRALFTQAGLDPNKPPTTWDEVRADAKKISALGNGIVGYGDYSAANTGGWHFTAELYSLGGSMVTGDGKTAAFNNATGVSVLNDLKAMRWTDDSMGTKQLLQYNDLLQMMGSGKLGMYVGAPDNLTSIHTQFNDPYTNLGMGAMPGTGGTLLGGDGYMFNKNDTPQQIEAGLKWLSFQNLTPGSGQFNFARSKAAGQPVGLPQPALWQPGSSLAPTEASDKAADATLPIANFQPYISAESRMTPKIEPPQAQAIYAQGDKVMSAILTNASADPQQLLSTFASQVNSILANNQ